MALFDLRIKMEKKIIIALGSNFEPQINVEKAKQGLGALFPEILFSRSLWTEPVGIQSPRFVNALAIAHTSWSKEKIESELKRLEKVCGRCREEKEQGVIRIDLDLMLYGEEKLRLKDWNRKYIFTLMNDLEEYL